MKWMDSAAGDADIHLCIARELCKRTTLKKFTKRTFKNNLIKKAVTDRKMIVVYDIQFSTDNGKFHLHK